MTTQLNITYRKIWQIAFPLILGSAGQNIVALSDSIFLYYKSEEDFAAIGFVGVFYLVMSAIGYGFSKGGQVMIARRMGEGKPEEVGRNFFDMLYFQLILAVIVFLFLQFGCPTVFKYFMKSPVIYEKSLAFLKYRAFGVFFTYSGLAIISLYTGVARTKFIMIDTGLLGILNIFFCYAFVFGKFGFPDLGIVGAGLASTLAEIIAFILFIVYMVFDKKIVAYHLFKPRKLDTSIIREQMKISLPSVAQPVVGIGSWFLFFSFVETYLGVRDLAITNLVRMVYLFLSIPSWGFASSINTLVSNVIGQKQYDKVFPTIHKTTILCISITATVAIPILFFPVFFLQPLLTNTGEANLVIEAIPILRLLFVILALFSIGGIYFNALASTGAASVGLLYQFICVVIYLAYIYFVLRFTHLGLLWAWSSEILYWILMIILVRRFLKSNKWHPN